MNEKTAPLKTYREHERDLAILTDLLTEALKRHAERAAAEPESLGFTDELHEARRRMIQALAAISGTREETIEESLAEMAADLETERDIGDDLVIAEKKRQVSAGGIWVVGSLNGHRFEALVFSEHALSASYELDDSRISKLRILEIASKEVANFDRGWDLQPQTPTAQRIVDFLAAGLADYVYAQ